MDKPNPNSTQKGNPSIMSADQLQFPDSRHNHAPHCCCDDAPDLGGTGPCPACPEHGELTPGVECPQCHQPAGRPHTDYCTLSPDAVWTDQLGQTSQPATRTSQPHTEVRELAARMLADDLANGVNPFDEPTPIAAGTPGHCHSPGCHRDYDQAPGPGCQTPGVHDNPR